MADCKLTLLGKNGGEIGEIPLQLSSENPSEQELNEALINSNIQTLLRLLRKNSESEFDSLKGILLDRDENGNFIDKVVGNYNANNLEEGFKARTNQELSTETKNLLNLVKEHYGGDVNFVLLTNTELKGKTSKSGIITKDRSINGAMLRDGDNPLVIINTSSTVGIENVLRHELVHMLWDKVIKIDEGIQNSIKNLYNELSKDDNSEIKNTIKAIKNTGNENNPNEIFAYLFSFNQSYNYIMDKHRDLFDKLNEQMPIPEPTKEFKEELDDYNGITKIISGAQTGIDQLGLIVGKELGIETGGTAPINYKTEGNGLTKEELESLGVTQISQELEDEYWSRNPGRRNAYVARTEQNIINSDGTVYFDIGGDQKGKNATERFAKFHNKPFILNPSEEQLNEWLKKNNIKTLNVAGNRASKINQDFKDNAKSVLSGALASFSKYQEADDANAGSSNFVDIDRAISFNDAMPVSPEQQLPTLVRETGKSGYKNIEDAYNFLQDNEDAKKELWESSLEVNSLFQMANIQQGDLLRMYKLDFFDDKKLKELGIINSSGDKSASGMYSLDDLMVLMQVFQEMLENKVLSRNNNNRVKVDNNKKAIEKPLISKYSSQDDLKKLIMAAIKSELSKRGFNDLTDKQVNEILEKQKKFLENKDNQKYRYYTPDYIVAGSFFHQGIGKYVAIIPYKFGKNGVKQVYVALDGKNITGHRKLHDDFKTKYEWENGQIKKDSKGNPIVKPIYSSIDVKNVSDNDLSAAENGLTQLKAVLGELTNEEQSKIKENILEQGNTKKGDVYYRASSAGLQISGFRGDLNVLANDALPGTIIKYVSTWKNGKPIMEYAVKVMSAAGGIHILTLDGELKTIDADSITSLVLNKELYFDKNSESINQLKEDLFTVKSASKRSRYKKTAREDNNISIYPFWEAGQDRVGMAKNLKMGDKVNIRFFNSDGQAQEFIAPIVMVTSTKIYYLTNGEKLPIMSVNIDEEPRGKWINKNGEFKYGETLLDGTFSEITEGESFIIAAYQENHYPELRDYLKQFNELNRSAFGNKKVLKVEDSMGLDDLTNYLSKENFGFDVKPDENGVYKIPMSKSSLSSEWNTEDLSELNISEKAKICKDLQIGDILRVKFTSKDGKETEYWGMFKGYNQSTGEPQVIAVNDSKKRGFGVTVNPDQLTGVGKRILPITRFRFTDPENDIDEIRYANTSDIESLSKVEGVSDVKIISKGRPHQLAKLKDRITEFINDDRTAPVFTEDEIDEKLKLIDGKSKFYETSKVAVILQKDSKTGEDFWGIPKNDEELKKAKEVRYKIKITRLGSEKGFYAKGIDFNSNYYDLWKSGKYGFDEMIKVLTPGDLVTYEVSALNNKNNDEKIYIEGLVTNVADGYIELSYFKKEYNEEGTLYFPKNLYWFKSKQDEVRITKAYVSNVKAASDAFKNLSNNSGDSNVETKIKEVRSKTSESTSEGNSFLNNRSRKRAQKSKDTNLIKKSFDSKESIIRVSNKLTDLYGVKVQILSTEEMTELGNNLGINLGDARAFAMNGEIFINVDKASTADVLHEFTHILLPGLKAMNPLAFEIMMSKLLDHPTFNEVLKEYPELSSGDLAEEAFCTIFGEYFRNEMISKDEEKWLGGEFESLASTVPSILSDVFNASVPNDANIFNLMNMSIEDIMIDFGSRMIRGDFQKEFKASNILHVKSFEQKIYQQLIDSGTLKKIC